MAFFFLNLEGIYCLQIQIPRCILAANTLSESADFYFFFLSYSRSLIGFSHHQLLILHAFSVDVISITSIRTTYTTHRLMLEFFSCRLARISDTFSAYVLCRRMKKFKNLNAGQRSCHPLLLV